MFLSLQIGSVVYKRVRVPRTFNRLTNYKARELFLQDMVTDLMGREDVAELFTILRETGVPVEPVLFFLDHVPSKMNYTKLKTDD